MEQAGIYLIGRGHLGQVFKRELDIEGEWTGDMEDMPIGELQDFTGKYVVCCAGKTDLSWCEENQAEAFRCNVIAPLGVLRKAIRAGKCLIHLSSGCIWDGPFAPGGGPFGPQDPPEPASFYAWTKAACDALMLQEPGSSGRLVILRPRQVYSAVDVPRNTLAKLTQYEGLIDVPNSMTSAYTIAKTIRALCQVDWADWFPPRVLAPYDRGVTSPLTVGMMLADAGLRNPPGELQKESLDRWLVPRRVDVVMRDERFEDWVDPPSIEEELERVIAAFKGNRN